MEKIELNEEFKICNKCKQEFPRTSEYFNRDNKRKDGLYSTCKKCQKKYREQRKEKTKLISNNYYLNHKEQILLKSHEHYQQNSEKYKLYRLQNKEKQDKYNKEYRSTHEENKEHKNELRIKRQYGITINEYNDMLKKQDNKCAICGKELIVGNEIIHIDHSHITGKVRGILCMKCNLQLGVYENNKELFKLMAKYLETNN